MTTRKSDTFTKRASRIASEKFGLTISEKPNKYNARKTMAMGLEFDSKLEAHRFLFLKSKEQAGEISDVKVKPGPYVLLEPFTLYNKNWRGITYTPDFSYRITVKGRTYLVIEDTKGFATEPSKMRMKMFMARYCLDRNDVLFFAVAVAGEWRW